MTYSIMVIETAINYWRVSEPSPDSVGLCPPARALANVYGRMIYEHATEVARSNLTDAQGRAVAVALERLNATQGMA